MGLRKYLTPSEVAEAFKVKESTVYSWAYAGRIPSVKIGRTLRIPANELADLLEAGAR